MPRTEEASAVPPLEEPRRLLSRNEWLVLRACHRLGSPALTRSIVGEVQAEELCEYRYVQSILGRLHELGYVTMSKVSARRSEWSLAVPYRDVLREEIRLFIDHSLGLGLEGDDFGPFYEALAESKAVVSAAEDDLGLSDRQRVGLIDCLRPILERPSLRDQLAERFGLSLKGQPAEALTIQLIKAAGGHSRTAVSRILDEIEALEGKLDSMVQIRVAALREDLEVDS